MSAFRAGTALSDAQARWLWRGAGLLQPPKSDSETLLCASNLRALGIGRLSLRSAGVLIYFNQRVGADNYHSELPDPDMLGITNNCVPLRHPVDDNVS